VSGTGNQMNWGINMSMLSKVESIPCNSQHWELCAQVYDRVYYLIL